MFSISIHDNFPAVIAELNRLPAIIGNKALVRALNTSAAQGKTEMARAISQEFRMSVSEAKQRLGIRRAHTKGGNFEVVLHASRKTKGRGMNLIAFVVGQRKKRKGQIAFQIKRGGGKKVIPGAFVANAGRTVFVREGAARKPIRGLSTIDISQMFNTRKLNHIVITRMLNSFEKNFARELRSVLRGFTR